MVRLYLVLFWLLISPCLGATYYVDFAGGADTNNGTADSTPFQHCPDDANATDTAASTTLAAGDVCYFKRGVNYLGSITVDESGALLTNGTNGVIDATGLILTASGETFSSDGVTNAHSIFINGEGLFGIASVDSETQITLANTTFHRSLSSVAYCVSNPITFSGAADWGTGTAIIDGDSETHTIGFVISGKSHIRIDTLQITDFDAGGVYSSSTTLGTYLLDLEIDTIGTVDDDSYLPGIYLANATYILIDRCHIHDIGYAEVVTGADGIAIVSAGGYGTVQNTEIGGSVQDDCIQMASLDNGYIQWCNIHGSPSGGSHADGIASNSGGGNMAVTVRYNRIHDCNSPTDIEKMDFEVYGNIFYDTDISGVGNQGWRFKEGSKGNIYNNIFAYNVLSAIYGYNTNPAGPVNVKNNIFFENGSDGAANPDVFLIAANVSGADPMTNNIFVRRTNPMTDDKPIEYAGTKYTVAAFDATANGADNQWNPTTPLFKNDPQAQGVDFRPFYKSSPQVREGITIADVVFDLLGSRFYQPTPTIGSYEFNNYRMDPVSLQPLPVSAEPIQIDPL